MKITKKKIYYLLLAGLVLFAPIFVKDEYYIHLLINAGFFYMLVAGLNLLVGYLGKLSLGHTAFLGIGAYTTALLSLKLNASFWLTLSASIVISLALSLLFGLIVLRLRGPYFVIVSLCFAEMLAIVATNWVSITNGPMGLPGIQPPIISIPGILEFQIESKVGFYYLMLVIVAIMTFIIYRLIRSFIGRATISLRENENLAESVGVSAFFYGMVVFVIGSVFAGVAGCFYAHFFSYINPEVFGFIYMITMLVMLVTGGKGTITGPLLGCFIFTVLPELLRGAKIYRDPVFGIILIIMAIFLPQGLAGLLNKLIYQFKEKSAN
jgi:branched-chain amino acid transport system permease protein